MLDIQIKTKEGITLKTANKFIPEDIILTIEENLIGINTTDATAEAADIVVNKTAYVKDEKITGSIRDWSGNYLLKAELGTFPEGLKEVVTSDLVNVVDYATVKIVDNNLKAENILEDVTVLGITGTCRPYEEPKLQEKTVNSNGEVLPDIGYEGLSKVIVDMSGYDDRLKRILDKSKCCYALCANSQVTDLSNYIKYTDTSNVTNMDSMFLACRNLTTIPQLNTSNVTNMDNMFNGCTSLQTIPQLDTSKVVDMGGMFLGCKSLTTIPQLDTSKVTSMNSMFGNCSNLTTIPQLDTSNVTDMSSMFFQSWNLTSIPHLNTSNVTNMSYMFGSTGITIIPLLNTSNVISMSGMFFQCSNLTTIPQLDTSNVTDMSSMFRSCYKLASIPQLDTSKVTAMDWMFHYCSNLKIVPQLDTSKVTNMGSMFYSCTKLEKIDLTYYGLSSNNSQIFYNCHSLKELIIRSFGVNYAINSNAFTACYHLTGTVNSTYNPNGDKDCYIYVPREMVDTLKSTAGWLEHSSQIRALEDYTVDGTTRGDLDPNKIN